MPTLTSIALHDAMALRRAEPLCYSKMRWSHAIQDLHKSLHGFRMLFSLHGHRVIYSTRTRCGLESELVIARLYSHHSYCVNWRDCFIYSVYFDSCCVSLSYWCVGIYVLFE